MIKNIKNTRKNRVQLFCAAIFVVLGFQGFSQTLQRQCIGSGGSHMITNGMLIQQTVGQPYSTNTNYSDGVSYRPGFQQPIYKVDLIHSTINLNVFPNPATNWVTINSSKTLKDAHIRIVEIAGKLLLEETIAEFKSYTFNCENWLNGTYVISLVDSKGKSYSSKLIILR
jgi:hypothetical protein